MSKFVILFSKLITAVAVALSLTSCKYSIDLGNSITGSGHVVSEDRNVGTFDKIRVSQGLECEIFEANDQKVTVEADDNLVNDIQTTVENGTLVISSDYNNYVNVASKKVIVHVPKITGLETNSGSYLKTGNTLTNSNSVRVKSSSGSSLDVDLEAETITLESTSGSEQNVRGKALKLNTASSSGSHIDAKQLIANEVYAQSTSGSSTSVKASILLDAKASSGSSINYSGKAQEVRKEETSGGSVSKE